MNVEHRIAKLLKTQEKLETKLVKLRTKRAYQLMDEARTLLGRPRRTSSKRTKRAVRKAIAKPTGKDANK